MLCTNCKNDIDDAAICCDKCGHYQPTMYGAQNALAVISSPSKQIQLNLTTPELTEQAMHHLTQHLQMQHLTQQYHIQQQQQQNREYLNEVITQHLDMIGTKKTLANAQKKRTVYNAKTAILPFIFANLSIVFCLMNYFNVFFVHLVGIVFGVLTLVFGINAAKEHETLSVTSIILGCIGLLLGLAALFAGGLIGVAAVY